MLNEYDLLLHWLSARPRGEASTAAITEACVTLAQRASLWQPNVPQHRWRFRFLGALHRLGHVEPVGRSKWAVIPHTVLWMAGKSQAGEAHVYGARSTTLWHKLHQIFGEQLRGISQPNGSTLWQLTGTRDNATELAHALEGEMYEERGEVMLASLPSLTEAVQHFKEEVLPSPGEHWKFFQVRRARYHGVAGQWVDMARNQPLHPGVYRIARGYPTRWVHISRKPDGSGLQARTLDERNPEHSLVACWFELARNGQLSLKYDATAKKLMIPTVGIPLPVLVDRALRLASGTSPDRIGHEHGTYFVYKHIVPSRAHQAGRVLGLPVETWHE